MDTELDENMLGFPQGEEEINREGMQWYVVHCLTSQESRAKRNLDASKITNEMQDKIGMVVVPTERVTETKQNKKKTVSRKFFPGYILVQAAVYTYPDSKRPYKKEIDNGVWNFIQRTPGIIGFLGSNTLKGEKNPIPLTSREVSDIFEQARGEDGKARVKIDYEIGEIVQIIDGAFKGSSGPIDKVDPDRGKLNVTVTVFGRPVAVELEYWQVEKQNPSQVNPLG